MVDGWPRIPGSSSSASAQRSGGSSLPAPGAVIMASVEEDMGAGMYALRWSGNRISVFSRVGLTPGQSLILKSEMSSEGKPTLVVQGPALPDAASQTAPGRRSYGPAGRGASGSGSSGAAPDGATTTTGGGLAVGVGSAAGAGVAGGSGGASVSLLGLVLEPLGDVDLSSKILMASAQAERQKAAAGKNPDKHRPGEAAKNTEEGKQAGRERQRQAEVRNGQAVERAGRDDIRQGDAAVARGEKAPFETTAPREQPPAQSTADRQGVAKPQAEIIAQERPADSSSPRELRQDVRLSATAEQALRAAIADSTASSVTRETAPPANPPLSAPQGDQPARQAESAVRADHGSSGASQGVAASVRPALSPDVVLKEALTQLVKAADLPLSSPAADSQALGVGQARVPAEVADKAVGILLRAAGLTANPGSLEAGRALLENNVPIERQNIQALMDVAAGTVGEDRTQTLKAAARLVAHDIPVSPPLADGLAGVLSRRESVAGLLDKAATALSADSLPPEAKPLADTAKQMLDLMVVDLEGEDAPLALERFISTFGRQALGKSLALVETATQATLENNPVLSKIDQALTAVLKQLAATEQAADQPAGQPPQAAEEGGPSSRPSAPAGQQHTSAPPAPPAPENAGAAEQGQAAPPAGQAGVPPGTTMPSVAQSPPQPLPGNAGTPSPTGETPSAPEASAPARGQGTAAPAHPDVTGNAARPDGTVPQVDERDQAQPEAAPGSGDAEPPPQSAVAPRPATRPYGAINAYLRTAKPFSGVDAPNLPPMPKVARLDQTESRPAASAEQAPAPETLVPLPSASGTAPGETGWQPVGEGAQQPGAGSQPTPLPETPPASSAQPTPSGPQAVPAPGGTSAPPQAGAERPVAQPSSETPAPLPPITTETAPPQPSTLSEAMPLPRQIPPTAETLVQNSETQPTAPRPETPQMPQMVQNPQAPQTPQAAQTRQASQAAETPWGQPRQQPSPSVPAQPQQSAPAAPVRLMQQAESLMAVKDRILAWGDELARNQDARDLLSNRDATMQTLRRLDSLFQTPGLNRMEIELLKPSGFLERFLGADAQSGGSAAAESRMMMRQLLDDNPEKRQQALRDLPQKDKATLRQLASRLMGMERELMRGNPALGRLADAAASMRDLGRQLLAVKAENLAGQDRNPALMLAEVPFKLADNAGDGRMQMFYRRGKDNGGGWSSRVILDLNTTAMGPVLGDLRFFGRDMVLNMFVENKETVAFLAESGAELQEKLLEKGFRLKSRFMVLPPPPKPEIQAQRPEIAGETVQEDATHSAKRTKPGRLDTKA